MHKKLGYWVGILLVSSLPLLAAAQGQSASTPAQPQPETAPASMSKAEIKAQQKAARKAERKQARQIKNAELKKLQQNGYGPQAAPNQYPENVLNAERRSAGQRVAPAAPASSQ